MFPFATTDVTPARQTPPMGVVDDDCMLSTTLPKRGSSDNVEPVAPSPVLNTTPVGTAEKVETEPVEVVVEEPEVLVPEVVTDSAPVVPTLPPAATVVAPAPPPAPLRQSTRKCTRSVLLKDYITYNTTSDITTHHALTLYKNQSSTSVQGNFVSVK